MYFFNLFLYELINYLNYFVPLLQKNLKTRKLKLNDWKKECINIKEDYYKLKVLCKRKLDREKFANAYEFFDKIFNPFALDPFIIK